MSNIKLLAKTRKETGKKAKKITAENKIMAVIYGPNSENKNLELNYRDFSNAYKEAGQSTLIDLGIEDQSPIKVLIQDIVKDPISNRFTHIDFYQLDVDKKLKVEVELNFVGEAPAVKVHGGELIKALDKIEVECLPKDLIKTIDVDIITLENIGDHICAKDIKLPEGLELVNDPEAAVIMAEEIKEEVIPEPRTEENAEEAKKGEEKKDDESTVKEGEKAQTDDGKKEGGGK